jgi:prolyl-tRNA synthetase
VRPTSETIIGEMFSRWVNSYRDLPILINQWANIVRWEMRTRLFLRTTEFLWQEGHTAHATSNEAMIESKQMLEIYEKFSEEILAMPVIAGEKPESERFPGALNTYCIEAMMQDGKALQAGTSHFLGQNFSKAFDIAYLGQDGQQHHCWTTSWGVSTRLIGGLIMTHSDDDGLRVPPRIAPKKVVILPIFKDTTQEEKVLKYCDVLSKKLGSVIYHEAPLEVEIDKRPLRGGEKSWSWVKKGIPIRIEIGEREVDSLMFSIARRDKAYKDKITLNEESLISQIPTILDEIQGNYFKEASKRLKDNTVSIDNEGEFYEFFHSKKGFVKSFWGEDKKIEEKLQKELSVTVRCYSFKEQINGKCIFTGKPGKLAIFGKSY